MQQLHTLDDPYREVFMLHALGDVSLKDISRLFKKSDSWARVIYYRAKNMILAKMKEGKPTHGIGAPCRLRCMQRAV